MTDNQKKIMQYLINQPNYITNTNNIVKDTKIPYGTVRSIIDRLIKEKYISKPKRYRKGKFHGIAYKILIKIT